MSWVCPAELACAEAPTFCANPQEVGACDGKMEHDPCRTMDVPNGQCIDDACQACSNDLAGCRYIGWNPMTSPDGTLTAVWFGGPADAYAGGDTGLFRYDGASWQADAMFPTLAMGDAVQSLSGVDDADLFAVMKSNNVVYHHAGGSWTSTMTSGLGTKAVWAATATDAFAVGFEGDIERFDGTGWTVATSTTTTANLTAVWGSSATDVYAVGGTAVTHWNGSTWASQTLAATGLDAVWGSGPNDVYAGGVGAIFHSIDGGATFAKVGVGTATVTALWGTGATDVFAGTSAGPILHSDDGVTWAPMITPVSTVSGIFGSAPDEVFAVAGADGVLRYTGASWTTTSSTSVTSDFTGVWVSSPSMVFAVGALGAIEHFDGAAWTPHDVAGTIDLRGVWARSATDAYAVGTTHIEHWDGTAWTSEQDPDNIDLLAVTGTSDTEYAAGTHLAMGSAGTWTDVTMFDSVIPSLWVAPDNGAIFFAGDQLYVYQGGALQMLLDEGGWNAIWGTSSSDVFAAGAGGKIRHYDGTTWSTPLDTATSVDLHALWGTSDDDVFAAGDAGTLLHYHAQLWSIVPPPAGVTASFASVAGAGSTIFVVGASGTAVRLIESAP
jgi:hypothetical protein